ncbi:MAG TPA: hypothetical protein VGU45_01610 [Microvirga sp.]|jgi:hypothetical protein|nr:hypothetical protein [Microvirga sp.]
MAKSKGMSEGELASLLDGQISDATSYEESELSSHREKALAYYEGTMDDLPAQKGKSSVVSHDVADTHGWIMPGLMRVFLASDRVADFAPVGVEDMQWSKDATDGVNFLFLERCDGYHQLRSAIHDGLLLGNGIFKHWWDASPCYKVSTHTGLSEDEFVQLVADDDVEVLEHTERQEEAEAPGGSSQGAGLPVDAQGGPNQGNVPAASGGMGPGYGGADSALSSPASAGGPDSGLGAGLQAGTGGLAPGLAGAGGPGGDDRGYLGGYAPQLGPVTLHDVKIKRTIKTGRLRCEALPPEEFLIERDATRLTEEHCRFAAHRSFPTRSDLIKQGYDRKTVDALPAYTVNTDESAKTARDDLTSWVNTNQVDKSVERVEIFECYVLVDYDGDGVAEWRRIVIGGRIGKDSKDDARRILANDLWDDDLPFTDIVPDPVPHRWRGRSVFDETQDIQRVKTVLTRQMLDNLYLSNNPQRMALLDAIENMDEVINPTIGGVILAKRPDALVDLAVPFVADKSFSMVEYMDAVIEKRTGVSRASAALDPEVLSNQTATAANLQASASQSKVELYARNIAETGLKRLFKSLLKLVIKHQNDGLWIRRQGKPVKVDPAAWNADMDVSINVGLGSGRKDQEMALLQAIAMKQELILQTLGPDNPLVDLTLYRNTLAKMVEIGGARSPELYFKEVDTAAVQQMMQAMQSKPDPEMQKMQAQMQIEQMKAQVKAQADAEKLQMQGQFKERELQLKAEMERVQAEADMAVQRTKLAAELQLKEREFELERQQMQFEMAMERQKHQQDMAFRASEHQANLNYQAQEQETALHFKSRDQDLQHDHAERSQKLKEKQTATKGAE